MTAALTLARGTLEGALRALGALSVLLLGVLAIGPRTGLYRPVTVLSNSMAPTFSRGDLVIATPEPLERLRVGQVVTFQIPVGDHRVESHRIVDVIAAAGAPVVRTKGDPRVRLLALFLAPALLVSRLLVQIWAPGGLRLFTRTREQPPARPADNSPEAPLT